jgi:hypothetical protein
LPTVFGQVKHGKVSLTRQVRGINDDNVHNVVFLR